MLKKLRKLVSRLFSHLFKRKKSMDSYPIYKEDPNIYNVNDNKIS